MASQDKPDVNTVWASEGTVEPIDEAKQKLGYVEEIPFWDNFNWLMQQVSGFMKHINQEGIARWDVETSYTTNSWAKGSNGVVYISLKPDHAGNDPTAANSTFWQSITDYIAAAMPGRLLNIQVLYASGTYIPTPGTKRARVKGQAAGGAGGSGNAPTTVERRAAGGGAGGYFEAWILNPVNTAVQIGLGGAPSASTGPTAAGGNGGDTKFGLGITAFGGKGGTNNNGTNSSGGGLGGEATGGYFNAQGGDGSDAPIIASAAAGGSGDGGASYSGGGVRGGSSSGGSSNNTRRTGSGGGGTNTSGSKGSDGYMIIEEYS